VKPTKHQGTTNTLKNHHNTRQHHRPTPVLQNFIVFFLISHLRTQKKFSQYCKFTPNAEMDFAHLIEVPKIDSVVLHRQLRKPISGTLCLTFSHIIVSERHRNESDDDKNGSEELWVSVLCFWLALSRVTVRHVVIALDSCCTRASMPSRRSHIW
jgi:hypothetical protein